MNRPDSAPSKQKKPGRKQAERQQERARDVGVLKPKRQPITA